jgi:hypothetical protein
MRTTKRLQREDPLESRAQRALVLGLGTTSTLRRHVDKLEASAAERFAAGDGGKVRRCKEFYDAAASWNRARRVAAGNQASRRGAVCLTNAR